MKGVNVSSEQKLSCKQRVRDELTDGWRYICPSGVYITLQVVLTSSWTNMAIVSFSFLFFSIIPLGVSVYIFGVRL
jgi:hypothetical protein